MLRHWGELAQNEWLSVPMGTHLERRPWILLVKDLQCHTKEFAFYYGCTVYIEGLESSL